MHATKSHQPTLICGWSPGNEDAMRTMFFPETVAYMGCRDILYKLNAVGVGSIWISQPSAGVLALIVATSVLCHFLMHAALR